MCMCMCMCMCTCTCTCMFEGNALQDGQAFTVHVPGTPAASSVVRLQTDAEHPAFCFFFPETNSTKVLRICHVDKLLEGKFPTVLTDPWMTENAPNTCLTLTLLTSVMGSRLCCLEAPSESVRDVWFNAVQNISPQTLVSRNVLQDGTVFVEHDSSARQIFVTLRSGILKWGPVEHAPDDDNEICVEQINNLYVGKQRDVFLLDLASSVDKSLCFSLTTTDRVTLNLEATSSDIRNAWFNQLKTLCHNARLWKGDVLADGIKLFIHDITVATPTHITFDVAKGHQLVFGHRCISFSICMAFSTVSGVIFLCVL